MDEKPILVLDFDGVIHCYSKGWQDGSIYDGMTDGFVPWAILAQRHFQLVIYSSRSKDSAGIVSMMNWLINHLPEWHLTDCVTGLPKDPWMRFAMPNSATELVFTFAREKPAAFLTIDDRAVRFEGDWGALTPAMLRDFKPWNYQPKPAKDDRPMHVGGGIA